MYIKKGETKMYNVGDQIDEIVKIGNVKLS